MKKKNLRNKEEIAEDYCFTCKDGGHLRVCDFKNCLKAYHPHCVGKDQSFLESEESWTCGWHTCFICHKGSTFQCYCCSNSLCRGCIRAASFVQVKKKTKGFCNNCLKLAILVEENADVDSDGGKVDFKDTETYEFLFKDYWEIIKDQEGLTLVDLHAADALLKRGEICESGSDSDKLLQEELMSEVDDACDNEISLFKGSKGKHGGMKTPKRYRKRRKTYIGWGSGELIGFLSSIGKDTKEALSQLDVSEIVKDYIQTNNLFLDPDKKKRKIVKCDERLQSLFHKTKVKIYKIYSLLESHLAANADSDDEISFSSEEGDKPDINKKRHRVNSDSKVKPEQNIYVLPKSEFAAVVERNIKAIYLRKSLIVKLLNDPQTFEEKVTGCFVRVKSDPKDFYFLSHKLYQLGRVEGIKKVPQAYKVGEICTDIVLCVSNMWKDIHIYLLSDDDFEEEECEDLRRLVKERLFKRPTIAELEKKINSIHEDIMNHWIDREILRLQKLIDRANEKGWRRELFEYIEKRERLRTLDGRTQLLKEIPCVIADMEVDTVATASATPNLHGVYQGNVAASIGRDAVEESEGIGASSGVPVQPCLGNESVSTEPVADEVEEGCANNLKAPLQEVEGNTAASIGTATVELEGIRVSSSVPAQLNLGNGAALIDTTGEENGGLASGLEVSLQEIEEKEAASIETDAQEEAQGFGDSLSSPGQLELATEDNWVGYKKQCIKIEDKEGVDTKDTKIEDKEGVDTKDTVFTKIEIIDLDDDDDDDDDKDASMANSLRETCSSVADTRMEVTEAASVEDHTLWHYIDPAGVERGPFTMQSLGMWREHGYFDADFKVWRTGQSPKEAILLSDALRLRYS